MVVVFLHGFTPVHAGQLQFAERRSTQRRRRRTMAIGGRSRGVKVAPSSAPAGSLDATMELINSQRFSNTEAIELDDVIGKVRC